MLGFSGIIPARSFVACQHVDCLVAAEISAPNFILRKWPTSHPLNLNSSCKILLLLVLLALLQLLSSLIGHIDQLRIGNVFGCETLKTGQKRSMSRLLILQLLTDGVDQLDRIVARLNDLLIEVLHRLTCLMLLLLLR